MRLARVSPDSPATAQITLCSALQYLKMIAFVSQGVSFCLKYFIYFMLLKRLWFIKNKFCIAMLVGVSYFYFR